MLNYLTRRFFLVLITLVLITFLIYGLIRAMPGTPLDTEFMDPSKIISPEDLQRRREAFGLHLPWYKAYFHWLGNVVQLDFGHSFVEREPVSRVVYRRIGPTLLLSSTSLFLSYLLAVPLGLFATVRSGKPDERAMSLMLYMLYSLPSFVAALMLQSLFAVKFVGTPLELPLFGLKSDSYDQMTTLEQAWDLMKHMILPVTCFTYGSLAYFSRFVKANMEEVIRQDYIRTARAKGVGTRRVIVHHAFRNTLVPFVTLVGLTLPALLSGAVILEQIFNWPGMGQLFFDSILRRDYETIMGLTLMFSIMTLAGQLLADILYAVVDPRITYD